MSRIETMIKELQTRKKKIDYISYVAELIKNDKQGTQFKEVQKEIVEQIEPLLIKLMTDIENEVGKEDVETKSASTTTLTAEDVGALKMLAQKTLERVNAPNHNSPYGPPAGQTPPKTPPPQNSSDKMSFAMNNRHLANKIVKVLDKNGNHVATGTIVGLDAPNVVVQTEQGPAIDVPLDKIVLMS